MAQQPAYNPWAKMLEDRLKRVRELGKGSAWEVAAVRYQIRKNIRGLLAQKVSPLPKFRPVYRIGHNGVSMVVTGEQNDLFVVSGSSFNRKAISVDQALQQREYLKRKKLVDQWVRDLTGKDPEPVHTFPFRSRSKFKDKATEFWESCEGNRIFLTLTFIQDVSHQLAVGILNKFLTVLRKEFPGLEYIWCAEQQEQNKNRIHFHMILNKFLPVQRYNGLWVLQQYNSGLRASRKKGSEIDQWEVECLHKAGCVGKVLNPATMRKADDIGGLNAYLTAYVSKQIEGTKYGCRVWHCSRGVSQMFTRELTYPSTFKKMTDPKVNAHLDLKTGEVTTIRPRHKRYCSSVYIHRKKAARPHLKMMVQTNKWTMKERRWRPIFKWTQGAIRRSWVWQDVLLTTLFAHGIGKGYMDEQGGIDVIKNGLYTDRQQLIRKFNIEYGPLVGGRDDVPTMSLEKYRYIYLKESAALMEIDASEIFPRIPDEDLPACRTSALRKRRFTDEDFTAFSTKYFSSS